MTLKGILAINKKSLGVCEDGKGAINIILFL